MVKEKVARYIYNFFPRISWLRIGGAIKYSLMDWKTCSHSLLYSVCDKPWSEAKNGCSLSKEKEMNILRATNCQVRAWICLFVFGDVIFNMACSYLEFTSIQRFVTKYPKKFPDLTRNAHLRRFSLRLYLLISLKSSCKCLRQSSWALDLTNISSTYC